FWQIDAIGYSVNPKAEMTFKYADAEQPAGVTNIKACRWNGLSWSPAVSVQTFNPSTSASVYPLDIGNVANVTTSVFSPWVLAGTPSVTVSHNVTLCAGESTVLSVVSSVGEVNFTWSPADGLTKTLS